MSNTADEAYELRITKNNVKRGKTSKYFYDFKLPLFKPSDFSSFIFVDKRSFCFLFIDGAASRVTSSRCDAVNLKQSLNVKGKRLLIKIYANPLRNFENFSFLEGIFSLKPGAS